MNQGPAEQREDAPTEAAAGRLRAWLPRGRAARWLTALGALVLAWLLFAWLGFEPLVKWAAPKYVAAHGGRVLTLDRARLDPFRLAIELAGLKLAEPDGRPLLALGRFVADFELASVVERAYTFREIRIEAPVIAVELAADGRVNWREFASGFVEPGEDAPPPEREDSAPPRLKVGLLAITEGRVDFADLRNADGFRTDVHALNLEVQALSTLPGERARHSLHAALGLGGSLQGRGELALHPLDAQGELAVDALLLARLHPYFARHLDVAPPGGRAKLRFGYAFGLPKDGPVVRIEQAELEVDGLSLAGANAGEPALRLDSIALAGGRFDLGARLGEAETIRVAGGRLALQRLADGGLDVMRWIPAGRAIRDEAGVAAGAHGAGPWRFRVGRLDVGPLAVRYLDHGFASPLTADAGRVSLGLRAEASLDGEATGLRVDEIGLELADLRVASAAIADPVMTLARATLAQGRLSLGERTFAAARLAFSGGRLAAGREADGRLPLLEALRPLGQAVAQAPGGSSGQPSAQSPAQAGGQTPAQGGRQIAAAQPARPAAGWRARADVIAIDDFALALSDASTSPVTRLAVRDLALQAKGVSEDLSAAVPVQASFNVDGGGRLEASGEVVPGRASADLRVRLAGLALRPAQPYLARFARVDLVDGKFDTEGRVARDASGIRYTGRAEVRGLRVNEARSGERLLAWRALSTPRLELTQQGLRIGEMRADGLGAKLVIFDDRTVNLARVLAQGDANGGGAESAPAPASAASSRNAPGSTVPFRVDVERIALSGGEVDFADLSLALPFGTHIHDVEGNVVGVSNQPGGRARLQLEGRVDDYGLARADGQIDLFEPLAFTDTKLVFRNVEMSRLTPYSATFAGRRIATGKLSLDLEYKIENKALVGDNKIVIDKLTLGEKVESKRAADLPLDLAVALLQDSDGVIDLGLPVSGRLDDVEVGIGGIVWKAFTNVLTKIVTAPFRALGALLGVDGEKLSRIGFDPGRPVLLPPEREKLRDLAALLGKRPRLAVTIRARADPVTDAAALRERALRRKLAALLGGKAGKSVESGPLALDDPALQVVLERLAQQRLGADRLQALKKHAQAVPAASGPDTSAGGAGVPHSAAGASPAAAAGRSASADGRRYAESLVGALVATEPLDDGALRSLGEERAAAIRSELLAQGVPETRIEVLAAEPRGSDARGGADAADERAAAAAPAGAHRDAELSLVPLRAGSADPSPPAGPAPAPSPQGAAG